ncbi:hypothetical protein Tco_1074230 [Tanacetum coccineum]
MPHNIIHRSMEQASDITISQHDKAKIILTEPEATNISQLLTTSFSCEPTNNWERTLPTEVTLIFGRFLQAEEIAATDFPEHYFNFVAYNKLSDRLAARNPILTVVTQLASLFGTKWHGTLMYTNTTQWKSRSLLLSVHVTTTTTMVHPPTIVRLFRLLYILANLKPVPLDTRPQLSGTSATHYYFNPSIPETQLIRQHVSGLPQKLLSILSAHKGAGAIKSARHMDKNSKKSNPFQSARTTEHRRLKLTVNVNNGSATTTMPTSRRPDFVLDKVFERIQAPEGHHTSPEPEAAVTTHQDPAEYHGQGFEQGTSSENPDLPKPPTPPTPHTPPTTISQQSIIETNIQMSSEQEPIDKEGAHKKLPKESTRKTLFGHQPEADPIQVPKKQKTDP